MSKIIESTLSSIDGVVDDPGPWAMAYFDDAFLREATELLQRCDALLLGRGTYEGLSRHWPGQQGEYADAINGIRKYVFSSTLERADWNNSIIVSGDVVKEVTKIKNESEQDLVVFGHGRLSRTLFDADLLDVLRFVVHPIVVGGQPGAFRESPKTPLTLIDSHARESGVVVLTYRVGTAG